MKKLFALGFLSLAALAWASAPASAGWPCFGCGGCCNKCCNTVCIRQYNAFTPICCGSLSCNGACPMTFGGCGIAYSPYSTEGAAMPNSFTTTYLNGEGCYSGELPAPGMLSSPSPMMSASSNFQAPLPAGAAGQPMSWNPYMMQSPMMQAAAYQAMYGPQMMANPYAGGMPYYWNAGR
jgi:hypothetical protein